MPLDTFTLTLPLPTSVNRLYVGKGKNCRKTREYIAWLNEAGWLMNADRAKGRYNPLPPDQWYWTDIRLPENDSGDSDNRLKAAHDLLHKMGATPDDKWLKGGTYFRCPDVASGTCVVNATTIRSSVTVCRHQIKQMSDYIMRGNTGTINMEVRGQIS